MKPNYLLTEIYKTLESCGMKWDKENQAHAKRLGYDKFYHRPGYYAEVRIMNNNWVIVDLMGGGFIIEGTPYPTTFDITDMNDIRGLKDRLKKEFQDS